jgi:hypothetical protein
MNRILGQIVDPAYVSLTFNSDLKSSLVIHKKIMTHFLIYNTI